MAISILDLTTGDRFIASDEEGDLIITSPEFRESVFGNGGNDTIFLQPNLFSANVSRFIPEVVRGGAGNDRIIVNGANFNAIFGGDGNDSMFGGTTASGPFTGSTVIGPFGSAIYGDDESFDTEGHGDDFISSGPGDEFIDGGGGTDTLSYAIATASVGVVLGFVFDERNFDLGFSTGARGEDEIGRIENVIGGSGDDFIRGNSVNNRLEGGRGDDIIEGGDGSDELLGNRGNDDLRGGLGDDIVRGQRNNDELSGGEGDDSLFGNSGNDTLSGGVGNDLLNGGVGDDTADFRQELGQLEVDLRSGLAVIDFGTSLSADALLGIENIDATTLNDIIRGDNGANRLNGLPGNDTVQGRGGDDVLTGGPGNDLLNGQRGNDALSGGSGDDELLGGRGNDFLFGNSGDDIMRGGRGSDIIDGGTGVNTIVYEPGDIRAGNAGAQDTLVDFSPLFDTILFDGVFAPETRASDVFSVVNVAGGAVIVGDFTDTPNTGTSEPFRNDFARLPGLDANAIDLDIWQLVGAIEFV